MNVNSPTTPPSARPLRKIDGHVHLVGDGSDGTGCWLRRSTLKDIGMAVTISRHCGVPVRSALRHGLDAFYRERLLQQLRASSLDALVLLAMDWPHDEAGTPLRDRAAFYVPNDYVLRLARENPGEIVPAVSIHPARKDALEELDRCAAAGARVLKLLPNVHAVDCNDPRYRPFWKRLAEHRMIFLAHTGGELSLPVLRKDLQDPRVLCGPLDCGVTCVAAHCSGRAAVFDKDYVEVLFRMFRCHPNLYADTSAFFTLFRSATLRKALAADVHSRLVNGSDYPIPVWGIGAAFAGLLPWPVFRTWQRSPNVLERDYQFKRAAGFPDDHFTRWDALLRAAKPE